MGKQLRQRTRRSNMSLIGIAEGDNRMSRGEAVLTEPLGKNIPGEETQIPN